MIGLPFITELFTNVLGKSKGIGGRLFYCPKMGKEINTDDFDQVIKDQYSTDDARRYPCCIIMPPVSVGQFIDPNGEWEQYQFILFFLTTTYYTGENQIQDPNKNTNTSTHTILQYQHDMGRCARNFIAVMDKLCRSKGLVRDKFRIDGDVKVLRPVTGIGINNLSGIRLDFKGSLVNGCVIEDYNISDLVDIEIPENDSHLEHKI